MKQKFTLVGFEIFDGENSYYEYSILKKDTTNMSKSEIIKEVYEDDFECDYREVIVYSIQEITKEEVKTLEKLYMAFIT
tara:strand:- start:83 stop:319 length:237 start_codon:yes stop_codon:yes gene_type:complete